MQIHELNTFSGTPGGTDFFPIDTGFDTAKISALELLRPIFEKIAEEKQESVDSLKKKVNFPLDVLGIPDYGQDGQLLRTKGNGSTEWSNVGQPTDEQTAQAVTDWLNDHPEATTTVADGSLTYAKLVRGTLGYVMPEMFGAVGDGTTDDTIAVQSAINYCGANGLPLLLIKTYGVTALKLNYNNLMICGSGDMTGFSALDNSSMFTTDNPLCTDFTFRDFKMNGNSLGGKGFYSTSSQRLSSYLIDNLTIEYFDTAFDIESWVSTISNCWLSYNNAGFILHRCNALRIEGCSIFGFDNSENAGLGIKSTGYNTAIRIVCNTFQELDGAILLYSGNCYSVRDNYFEYNESESYHVILLDGTASRDLKTIDIEGNYIVATNNDPISQIAIDCRYVDRLYIGQNNFGTSYSLHVQIDNECVGIHALDPLTPKVKNDSRYVTALRTAYVEGTADHPANTYYTMAYDRYRYKPIWWTGSKWIFADGSDRT